MLKENNYNPVEIRKNEPELYSRYRNGILDVCEDYQHDKEVLEWAFVEENEEGEFNDIEYKPATVYWYYGPTGTGKSRSVRMILNKALKEHTIDKKM